MRHVRVLVLLLAAAALGGCDKCGDWAKPQFPSLPASCTGTAGK